MYGLLICNKIESSVSGVLPGVVALAGFSVEQVCLEVDDELLDDVLVVVSSSTVVTVVVLGTALIRIQFNTVLNDVDGEVSNV